MAGLPACYLPHAALVTADISCAYARDISCASNRGILWIFGIVWMLLRTGRLWDGCPEAWSVVRVPWAGLDIGLVGLVRAEKRRQAAALHMVPREVLSGSFCDGTAGRQDGEKKRHDN